MSIDEEEGPIAELITYFDTASWLCSIMKLIMSYHVQVLATQDVTSQALMNIFMVSCFFPRLYSKVTAEKNLGNHLNDVRANREDMKRVPHRQCST